MKILADSFQHLCDILSNSEKHHLSPEQIKAIEVAKKSISSIELLSIASSIKSSGTME